MEIGEKIQNLRKNMELSQEQLAEKVGVARQTISKWELGETSPDLEQAKELSKIFNVSLDDLINNDIKNILIEKVTKSQKFLHTIISLLKICLLLLIIIVIILVSIIFFKDYYAVEPVAKMQSLECVIDNHEYAYQIHQNNEAPYMIDKIVTNDDVLNIDTKKYTNFEDILSDIKDYVKSRDGYCK